MDIDNKYRIVYDENNVILQFHEDRIKVKKDGSKETYEFTDNYYYPTLKFALKAYLNRALKYTESLSKVLDELERIEDKIDNLYGG
jgi:hypothetical protein